MTSTLDRTAPAAQETAAVRPGPGRGFLAALGLASIGAGMASLVPAVLTLSLKAAQIDAANATTVLSVAVGIGSVFSLLAFPALGRLNLASSLPGTIVPTVAPVVLALGATAASPQDFTALFVGGAVVAAVGVLCILPIRGVR